MNANWFFNDGLQIHPCTSFPFAFRMMFNQIRKALEAGKNTDEMTRRFTITSPVGRVYDYDRATQLATDQGLLTLEGTINSREFKRK